MTKIISDLFSAEYNKLFIENIGEFAKAAKNKEEDYCAFYPAFGKDGKDFDFIIYGQAVKGWQPIFKAADKINGEEFIKQSAEYSNSFYADNEKGDHSPLDWVNARWSQGVYNQLNEAEREFYGDSEWGDYYTFRSFFWNVTYKLINRWYGLDENSIGWAKKIIWSNLYKIAPAERMNPSEEERVWQMKKSIELVKKEIAEINPRFCIVLTNDTWWEPFRQKLKTKTITDLENKEYIESYEQYPDRDTRIIVTKRPFSGGNSNICADEIISLIK